jgi:hypothetical protein
VVPPELFCTSREVTLEYWRDSIPEKALNFALGECDATSERQSESGKIPQGVFNGTGDAL